MKKLIFVLGFALLASQAMALEFGMGPVTGNLYGRLYLNAFYEQQNKDYVNYGSASGFVKDEKSSFDVALEERSRLGVELNFGKLKGVFEVGANLDNFLRLYYVQYDFDKGGIITFGQKTSIASYSFGQETLEGNSLCDYGAVNDYRRPMITYSIYGFEIALVHSGIDPDLTDSLDRGANMPVSKEFDDLQYIPRIELAYTYLNDFLEAKIYGSYAYYGNKIYYAGGKDKVDTSTWLVGVGGTYNILDGFVSLGAFYGSNLYLSGALTSGNLAPSYDFANNKLSSVDSWGAEIGLGYTFVDMFTPQVGFGYQSSSSSAWKKDDQAMGMYVNVICQLNKYIALIPEVAYLDDMKDGAGNKQGTRLFAGIIAKAEF